MLHITHCRVQSEHGRRTTEGTNKNLHWKSISYTRISYRQYSLYYTYKHVAAEKKTVAVGSDNISGANVLMVCDGRIFSYLLECRWKMSTAYFINIIIYITTNYPCDPKRVVPRRESLCNTMWYRHTDRRYATTDNDDDGDDDDKFVCNKGVDPCLMCHQRVVIDAIRRSSSTMSLGTCRYILTRIVR